MIIRRSGMRPTQGNRYFRQYNKALWHITGPAKPPQLRRFWDEQRTAYNSKHKIQWIDDENHNQI